MRSWRPAHIVFASICGVCEIAVLIFDRTSGYIGLGAFAYGLVLWLIARACIRPDEASEDSAIKTTATGWRLALRVVVVAATLGFVFFFERQWFWNSSANEALQRFSAWIHLGAGNTALPNAIFYVLIPGTLLFLLGAKPIELGLTAWRKGAWYALLGASVLPVVCIVIWFSKGHGAAGVLALMLVHNFLSNGFSEEFLMRGITMSHLRAFLPKDWALAGQALLFGLFHLGGFGDHVTNWFVETSAVIAMNAPIGFFLGLIALRARSVLLPGLIHTTLDTMNNVLG